MKNLFLAAAVIFSAAPAIAETDESLITQVVKVDISNATTVKESRSDVLQAAKSVCRKAHSGFYQLDKSYAHTEFRKCVKETYTKALSNESTGTLIKSAISSNDPYLLVR